MICYLCKQPTELCTCYDRADAPPNVLRPEDVRGQTHGPYYRVVVTAQNLKIGMRAGNEANFGRMTPIYAETLDMIAHKLARIAAGDFRHDDHWRDIAGYANLVVQEIEKNKANGQS